MSDFDYSSTYACAPRPPGTTDVLQWLQTWLNVRTERRRTSFQLFAPPRQRARAEGKVLK